MTIYKRKETGFIKWILALIIFILGMTITFSDVNGITISPTNSQVLQSFQEPSSNYDFNQTELPPITTPAPLLIVSSTYKGFVDVSPTSDPPPTNCIPNAVPEPSTLLLLSGGLGVLYLFRRK
ncbi:MAG: PEP-CTERM sorting domain-containing protein [FCB group bacterium]|nr:PEP-CTERM sorting domain-containing protein [FCB group bacterium]